VIIKQSTSHILKGVHLQTERGKYWVKRIICDPSFLKKQQITQITSKLPNY